MPSESENQQLIYKGPAEAPRNTNSLLLPLIIYRVLSGNVSKLKQTGRNWIGTNREWSSKQYSEQIYVSHTTNLESNNQITKTENRNFKNHKRNPGESCGIIRKI